MKAPALKLSFKEKQTKKMMMRVMKDHERQMKEDTAQEKQVCAFKPLIGYSTPKCFCVPI